MTKLAFLDTETTGLDPDVHQVWEVGLILADSDPSVGESAHGEHHWYLPVDLGRADPVALGIGQFHERYGQRWERKDGQTYTEPITPLAEFSKRFAHLTKGSHLIGAVISFDEERLRKLLRANGACPEWHYHLVDVEAMMAAALRIHPPWSSKNLSRQIGIEPSKYAGHTALGDARWARDVYEAVMNRNPDQD